MTLPMLTPELHCSSLRCFGFPGAVHVDGQRCRIGAGDAPEGLPASRLVPAGLPQGLLAGALPNTFQLS